MSRKLDRSIQSFDFLVAHRRENGAVLSPAEAGDLDRQIADAMRGALAADQTDPAGAIRHTRFVLRAMCDSISDRSTAECLRDICDSHLDRLGAQLAKFQVRTPELPDDLSYLDGLSERVALFDMEYRYIYTNRANCELHRKSPSTFIGRTNADVVGDRFFGMINKERFDAASAGKRSSYYSGDPCAPGRVFSVTFDPVRDRHGRPVGSLVAARDVSLLPIPSELILRCLE